MLTLYLTLRDYRAAGVVFSDTRKYKLSINQSINQSINFYGGLSNKKQPQGPRRERKLI